MGVVCPWCSAYILQSSINPRMCLFKFLLVWPLVLGHVCGDVALIDQIQVLVAIACGATLDLCILWCLLIVVGCFPFYRQECSYHFSFCVFDPDVFQYGARVMSCFQ